MSAKYNTLKGIKTLNSTSKLFPVSLVCADSHKQITEDVYLLTPNNSSDKTVQIALTRMMLTTPSEAPRPPLVLLHGCYQNRWLWLSSGENGLAHAMVRRGFDVWLMEARGHGMSPCNQMYERNTLADYACFDIPAVNAFVNEQCGLPPTWMGYGEGGGSVLLSLASKSLDPEHISGAIQLGLPFPASVWAGVPLVSLWKGAKIRRRTKKLRRGSEMEPAALLLQLLREQSWLRRRGESVGVNLWKTLEQIPVPLALCVDSAQQSGIERGLRRLHQAGHIDMINQPLPPNSLNPMQVKATLTDSASQLQALWGSLNSWLSTRVMKQLVIKAGI